MLEEGAEGVEGGFRGTCTDARWHEEKGLLVTRCTLPICTDHGNTMRLTRSETLIRLWQVAANETRVTWGRQTD